MCRSITLLCLIPLLTSGIVLNAQDRQVYYGLMHAHTEISDGRGTPDEAFDSARDAGLDFFALTEHNHSQADGGDGIFLTPDNYRDLITTATAKSIDGEFIAIYGQEVSTISKGNHENVFFAPEIVNMPNGDFRFLYEEWLPDHPEATFLQLNHPNSGRKADRKDYGIDDYDESFPALLSACDEVVALIEMIKGRTKSTDTSSPHVDAKYQNQFFYYLNKGFHVAPSAGGDDHRKTWGKSMKGRLGVWATELTRGGLEEAIRGRHCFATEDGSIEVKLTVDGELMGSGIEIDGEDGVEVKVEFSDESEPDAMYRIQVYYDDAFGGDKARRVQNDLVAAGTSSISFTMDVVAGGYLFAKVVQITQEDGEPHADSSWTAPVWFISPGAQLYASREPEELPTPAPGTANAISWQDAGSHVGRTVTVKGRIIRVKNHQGRILFMNFDPDFRSTLSIVVFSDNFEDFDAFDGVDALDERLIGKEVQIRGRITMFRNSQLQLVLRNPEQIVAVEGE